MSLCLDKFLPLIITSRLFNIVWSGNIRYILQQLKKGCHCTLPNVGRLPTWWFWLMKQLHNQKGKYHFLSFILLWPLTMLITLYGTGYWNYFSCRSAYITFSSKESVDKALELSGTTFLSRTIKVNTSWCIT